MGVRNTSSKNEELGRLPENVILIEIKQKLPELSGSGSLYYICGSDVCRDLSVIYITVHIIECIAVFGQLALFIEFEHKRRFSACGSEFDIVNISF